MAARDTVWWLLLGSACYSGLAEGGRGSGVVTGSSSDGGGGSGQGGSSGPGAEASTEPASAGSTESAGSDGIDEGETSAGPGAEEAPLAEHVTVTTIEVNQGVARAVLYNGEFIDDGELVAGRPALVRGLWTVEPGFVPRELEGRLLVRRGTEVSIYSNVVSVDGDADATTIQGGFLWEVSTADIDAGAEIAVEIREVDVALPGPDVGPAARMPAQGYQPLAIADTFARLEVMLVPLTYAAGGNSTVDLAQADLDEIGRALYDEHPVRELVLSLREPVVYSGAIGTTAQLNDTLAFLVDLRNADGASPQVYYAGLVDIGCPVVGCGSAGTNGIGVTLGDDDLANAQLRVSTSLWTDAITTADVLVHEVGHNQGLRHVPCPNTSPANATPDYPYADGIITGWGWAPYHQSLYGGNSFDYMTYCDPSWVSNWTWARTLARIDAVGMLADDAEPGHFALVGNPRPDGPTRWVRVAAGRPAQSGRIGGDVTFWADGVAIAVSTAVRYEIADGDGELIWIDLPAGAEGFDAMRWAHDGRVDDVSASVLRTTDTGARTDGGAPVQRRVVHRGPTGRR
ncbi:MAG: hypothetical protein IPH07_28210 [Deltaproteobacteria bacterium]|nr:hypothetical protein [Deltaproteobacteria bacterium]MBK8234059.1 hypothetical protein [Deltaproteobacteria bacterium]MBK8714783.1 hypothetical protein [Deltaproteobacteria bacterium]MBP7289541.1 hypothetical protein [Nannocystaceae bacterium]